MIDRLKDFEALKVLTNLLIESYEDQTKCNIIISFISHYLNIQSKHGVAVNRHNKKHICERIKTLFFC